jgi:hypothetical protein
LDTFEAALYGTNFRDPHEEYRRLPPEHVHVQGPGGQAQHGSRVGL